VSAGSRGAEVRGSEVNRQGGNASAQGLSRTSFLKNVVAGKKVEGQSEGASADYGRIVCTRQTERWRVVRQLASRKSLRTTKN